MSAFSELILRGGEARLTFGLVIEGVPETFVSDPSRAHNGARPWVAGAGHTAYEGLDVSGLQVRESASWRDAELDAEGVTVRVHNDHRDTAAAVFGGRQPSRLQILRNAFDSDDTSLWIAPTGWPTVGVAHVGREAIRYTGTTGSTLTGLVRGYCSSLAASAGYNAYDATTWNTIQVTDVPLALEKRRAQIYLAIDDDLTWHCIWRGVVQQVEQAPGYACSFDVSMDHVSALLDQDIGATLKPFDLYGFYFPDDAPLRLTIREHTTSGGAGDIGAVCEIELAGLFPTIDELVAAMDERVEESSAYWSTAPTNDQYHAQLDGDQVIITFRSDAAAAKWVDIQGTGVPLPGVPGLFHEVRDEDGGIVTVFAGLTTNNTYTIRPQSFRSDSILPTAACYLGSRAYVVAPEDGSAAANTADRLYYPYSTTGATPETVSVAMPHGRVTLRVLATGLTGGTPYLQVDAAGGDMLAVIGLLALHSFAAAPIAIEPVLNFGIQRWDQWLRALADATPTSGALGTTPWLPTAEFNWTAIEDAVRAAGGDAIAKRWVIYKSAKLRDMLAPELQLLGLCWATDIDGKMTVVRLDVAAPGGFADVTYDETVAAPALPVTRMSPEGIINDVRVRGGWDALEERYTRLDQGAQSPGSWNLYGRKTLVLEPQGEDPRDATSSALVAANAARVLCHSYAWPYAFIALDGCPGFRLAGTLVGDTVALTDPNIVHNGRQGVARLGGQAVARTVDWIGGTVSLTVRLTNWPAAAYAPSARVHQTSPLDGTSRIVTMRSENIYSTAPTDGSTRYDFYHFQVGDTVRIREVDTTTYSAQTGLVITRIDEDQKQLHFDQAVTLSLNTASKRFVVEYDDYDRADTVASDIDGRTGPDQHDYAFIAEDFSLGAASAPAQQWAP